MDRMGYTTSMTRVEKLESDVSRLSPDELSRFRAWFAEFDAALWDEQIELDAKSGKLDHLAEKAIQDFNSGNCKEL